ncbi:TRM-domain-containing protein [Sodiomyces alkalinus F11]|uniref:tRNA (guanine(26)-N(2))-dimethyltransferase n=1 Tax=Sodiomyces alkalinus (strain CBS 110278 / VKM F-3762 / F11) TaxID=1314773 RepID=A0A3N2Q1E2_SODAK|nr:TRM-domain-containing protein [Sodiomyces alkalinus F11]ROT40579.1 TRM-domain-containing protein [Sodiomyces alkalinus F11]
MTSGNQAPAVTKAATGEGETVTYDGNEYSIIREGLADILVPASLRQKDGGKASDEQQVFYNPIQQFNRDLSVLAIRAYGEDALANRKLNVAEKRLEKEKKKRRRAEGDDGNDRPAKVQAEPQTQEKQGSVEEGEDEDETKTESTMRPRFTILDALSATGLRALRYSHELPFVTSVTANDLTKSATESIQLNAKHNKLGDKIQVSHDDAIAHMYRRIADDLSQRDARGRPGKKNKYDVIDLDPYGTAAPFLDAAVQAVRNDGGLLCITCTDGSHWAGHSYVEKSFSLYGASPIKGMHSHEVGLRIILHTVANIAARYGLAVEPLLSLSIDFYCRIFVRVRHNPQAVSFLGGKTMLLYQCAGCSAWETQPLVRTRLHPKKKEGYFFKHGLAQGPTVDAKCRHCGSTMHVGGPLYGGPIHDQGFVRRMLDLLPTLDSKVYGTIPRMEGMLTTALEEHLPGPEGEEEEGAEGTEGPEGAEESGQVGLRVRAGVDPREAEMARVDHAPFFFMPSRLSGVLNCQAMPENLFRGALKHLGYRVTRSHCRAGSVKTDAPWETIWFVMREWVRQKAPVKTEKIKPNTPAYALLGLGQTGDDAKAKANASTGTGTSTGASKAEEGEEGEKDQPASDEELRKTLVFDDALARLGKDKAKGNKRLVRYQDTPAQSIISMPSNQDPAIRQAGELHLQDGKLNYTTIDDHKEQSSLPEEIVFVLKSTSPPLTGHSERFLVAYLREDSEAPGQPYTLHLIQTDHVPNSLLDSHLISGLPNHLSPEHAIHIIVSTKAGTGLALACWETVVRPLLKLLFSSIPTGLGDENGDGERYHVLTTRSAQSIKQFAKSLCSRRQSATTTHPETIILLSGDGGVIDLLNGREDTDNNGNDDGDHKSPSTNDPLPTIALLPLGTGNALFHSLHKPLYDSSAARTTAVPSPLVLGLRTLFRGRPAPLPSFDVSFSPGSQLVSYDDADAPSPHRHDSQVSRLTGAIVASYGFHAQLVWESDTPDYRRHGDKRFGMVAADLLRESHAYNARVHIHPASSSSLFPSSPSPLSPSSPSHEIRITNHQDDDDDDTTAADGPPGKFSYVLAAMVSNLERTFTVSPASRPLHPALHLVYFGPVGGERTMEIMKAAYDGGKHVALPDVGYEEVSALRVTVLEADARWRKVCIDGTVVEMPHGGQMTVSRMERSLFGVLVDSSLLG